MTMEWYWWVIGYVIVVGLLLRINYGIGEINKKMDEEMRR